MGSVASAYRSRSSRSNSSRRLSPFWPALSS